MSVEKQIPSLFRLYSFYEQKPEEIFDTTDVDVYFYHMFCTIFTQGID